MTKPFRNTAAIPPLQKALLADLFRSAQWDQAIKLGEKLRVQYPTDGFAPNVLGLMAQSRMEVFAAKSHFYQAYRRMPEVADYGANFGYACSNCGAHEQAAGVLQKTVRKHPSHVNARLNLIKALLEINRPEEALPHVNKLHRQRGDDPEVLRIKGTTLAQQGRFKDALPVLRRAQQEDPAAFSEYRLLADAIEAVHGAKQADATLAEIAEGPTPSSEAIMILADRLAQAGNLPEAIERFESGLRIDPTHSRGFLGLGRLRKWQPDDPLLPQLESLVSNPKIHPASRGEAAFALGKAYRDLDRRKASFDTYAQANALHRAMIQYDSAKTVADMRALPQKPIRPLKTHPNAKSRPVFILSLPRSGSTMLEQILNRHPDVASIGEDPTIHRIARITMETGDAKKLARLAQSHYDKSAQGSPVVTDKFLHNYLCVSALAEALPQAQFIFLHKDPKSAGYSLLCSPLTPSGHPYAFSQTDVADYIVAHHQLMQDWMSRYPDRILDLSYESLVNAPETVIPALLKQLNLSECDDCLSPEANTRRVDTLSLAQVRGKISPHYQTRWQQHEADLQPMLKRLADHGL